MLLASFIPWPHHRQAVSPTGITGLSLSAKVGACTAFLPAEQGVLHEGQSCPVPAQHKSHAHPQPTHGVRMHS